MAHANSPKYAGRAAATEMLTPIADLYRYLLLSRLAGRRLRALAECCGSDIQCLVSLAFNYRFRHPALPPVNIQPIQVFQEIVNFGEILKDLNPERVLEIGTAAGGTLFLCCRLASDDATIISVDLPVGVFGIPCGHFSYARWRIPLYMSFAKSRQMLHLVRGDSHAPRTLQQVKVILGNEKLDVLFIDGDHAYDGVKRDFEMYFPLVKKGGIIAFHDILPEHSRKFEAYKFWNKIKNNYGHMEIAKDCNQDGYGIGIIFM